MPRDGMAGLDPAIHVLLNMKTWMPAAPSFGRL